ncbi:S-methyl-5-thioribose kinase [Paenibacillus sp. P96]|uniref:Methylthioribose kinase n=1 Tax=Paenibacillus zeirhizosphaerae TaxID=2987519 RepID=A0ABT9FT74_9BACL|nr:S-methyl-5-thioribose kinase [Paenibacillus sp. P96]MDP4097937.1 S-methyl-5-thioribose kinase [Paenibacillus sp. P96]
MSAYHPLTNEESIVLARAIPGFFREGAELDCREIGDGNLNLVFHIRDTESGKSIIIKQALPYAKVVGESWPLSLDRARIEREALQIQHHLCSNLVPEVYSYDDEMAVTVMEDLSDFTIMRHALIEGKTFPHFADHIGAFIARTLFFTSDLAMDPRAKKEQVQRFINPDLCKITEDLIFDDPYKLSDNNNYPAVIEDEAEALRTDAALHLEVALLREKFLTRTEALLHGDLHTGSIFITEESTKVIDPEFAYYGPMGFDIGAVIANLLLNLAGQIGWKADEADRRRHQNWLLQTSLDVWSKFEAEFRKLWDEHAVDPLAHAPGYQDLYIQKVLQDAVGFAGAKMIRRIVGLSHVADIDTIPDETQRERAQRLALSVGKALILNCRKISSIAAIDDIVRTTATDRGETL